MIVVKDQCRLDIGKYSFSQRTINKCNKLSTDCVIASSMNMFKNKVNTSQEDRLHVDEHCWTLDGLSASLIVHLPSGPLPWMAILFILQKFLQKNGPIITHCLTN